jgi:hypothetical protein
MNIYIGDGSKIRNRIRNQHCNGNVESSSLRKHIAQTMGFHLQREQRLNGSTRVRLAMENASVGEQIISNYLKSGSWKFVICPPSINAKDFQFYAIQNITPRPLLNVNMGEWGISFEYQYRNLLDQLLNCLPHNFEDLINVPNESGVYLFLSEIQPL